jgi:SRSO17 transposase
MSSRFARLRVRVADPDYECTEPRPLETLLIEWPQGETEPTKCWLSTLPEHLGIEDLVRLVKIRWRIERNF